MSKIKTVLLSATRSSWQVSPEHGSEMDKSAKMKEVRDSILSRDAHTCYYCGFKAQKWQEIHHLNDDHSDFSTNNLTTVCALCHQCYHLGLAGSTGGGEVIWLPELTQVQLNHLVRSIFVAMVDESGPLFSSANSFYGSLQSRAIFMEQNFAAGASDPASLGQVLLKMKKDEYEKRSEFLKNIRLLPKEARFGPQIKYWADVVYKDVSPIAWEHLLKKEALESLSE